MFRNMPILISISFTFRSASGFTMRRVQLFPEVSEHNVHATNATKLLNKFLHLYIGQLVQPDQKGMG